MKNTRFVVSFPMEKGEAARNAQIASDLINLIDKEVQKENNNDTK